MTYLDPLTLSLKNREFGDREERADFIESLQIVLEQFANKIEKGVFWKISEESDLKSYITIPDEDNSQGVTFEKASRQRNLESGVLKVHLNYAVEEESDEIKLRAYVKNLLKIVNSNNTKLTGIIASAGDVPANYMYFNEGSASE
jgi:hypothetical protein